jgi:GDP-4-dehydro-6-deoxy-D-mannose reductase
MRVLVTGATGFVGQHLVRLLLSLRHSVYGTYLSQPPEWVFDVPLFRCDIRDAARILTVTREICPDQIYHLAGHSSPSQSLEDFKNVFDTNFWGTYNVLEAARQAVPKARVLVVGSAQCYGPVKASRLPIAEDEVFAPPNPYALSKAAADMLAGQYHSRFGLHIVRARPFNHTGPGQQLGFVCSDYAHQIAVIEAGSGQECPIIRVRDPQVRRDFTDVRDVVRAYVLLLQKGKQGEAYNVASGRLISIKEIVVLLASLSSRPVHISARRQRLRPGDVPILYGSNRKLRRATGWKPAYNIDKTLRDLFDYWKTACREDRMENAGVSAETALVRQLKMEARSLRR